MTLTTVFVAFSQGGEKKALLWPFLYHAVVFGLQTDGAGGNKYLLLTDFILKYWLL